MEDVKIQDNKIKGRRVLVLERMFDFVAGIASFLFIVDTRYLEIKKVHLEFMSDYFIEFLIVIILGTLVYKLLNAILNTFIQNIWFEMYMSINIFIDICLWAITLFICWMILHNTPLNALII